LAVRVRHTINRQDAKSAKKSAKKNFFQAAKDLHAGSKDQKTRVDP